MPGGRREFVFRHLLDMPLDRDKALQLFRTFDWTGHTAP
jgi:hypothetical protein